MAIEKDLWKIFARKVSAAADCVGVISTLCALVVYGVAAIAGAERAWAYGVAAFGLIGALEVFHSQRKTELNKRCEPPRGITIGLASSVGGWIDKSRIHQKFEHGGCQFFTFGSADKSPVPLAITDPLCPTCQRKLGEVVEVRFPGRVNIRLQCACGFTKASRRTLEELLTEAADMAGVRK